MEDNIKKIPEKSVFDLFNWIPFQLGYNHATSLLVQREKCLDNLEEYENYLHNLTKPPKDFESKRIGDRIESLWSNEVKRCGISFGNNDNNSNNNNDSKINGKKPSLYSVLLRTILPDLSTLIFLNFAVKTFCVISILELVNSIFYSVDELNEISLILNKFNPLNNSSLDNKNDNLFKKTNESFSSNSSTNFSYNDKELVKLIKLSDNEVFYQLIVKVFLLIIPIGLQTLVFAYIKVWRNKCGLKSKTALSQLISRKSIKLLLTTSIKESSSSALNLIANEVTLIEESFTYFPFILFGPFTFMIGSIWIAMRQTGWLPVFTTFFVVLLVIIILAIQANRYKVLIVKRKEQTKNRIDVTSSFLNSVKVAKMYGWESVFRTLIDKVRNDELYWLEKIDQCRVIDNVTAVLMTKILPTTVFISYIWFNGSITTGIMYTVVMGYSSFAFDGIFMFMNGLKAYIDIKAACKKIENYLLLPEIESNNNNTKATTSEKKDESIITNLMSKNKRTNCKIICKNLTINFDPELEKKIHEKNNNDNKIKKITSDIVKGLDVEMGDKELIMIIGQVGSGKSTLLMCLLNEIKPSQGSLEVDKSAKISYASQEAWILSDTIKNNIILGREFNQERYKNVIEACCLERDLNILPNGDETLVGTRGVSLSGGQRARVNLARCVYSKSDIYLLDDPLSAVDSRVAKHIFNNCIRKLLIDKLVILATHQRQFINQATKIIILERGVRPIVGTPIDLSESNVMLRTFNNDNKLSKKGLTREEEDDDTVDGEGNLDENFPVVDSNETKNYQNNTSSKRWLVANFVAGNRQVISPYLLLLKYGFTLFSAMLLFFLFIIHSPLNGFIDYYLRIWRQKIGQDLNNESLNQSDITYNLFLGSFTYGLLSITNSILSIIYQYTIFSGIRKASKRLHNKLMNSLFKARMSFYDFCSSGTLNTRYTGDFTQIDHVVPNIGSSLASCSSLLTGFFIMVIFVQPIGSLLFVLMFIFCAPTAIRGYKKSKILIDMSRMLRAPIYTNLSTIIDELVTIRSDKDYLKYAVEKFNYSQDKQTSMSMLTIVYEARISTFTRSPQVPIVAIIFYLKFVYNSDDLDVATVGVFLVLINSIVNMFPFVIELLGSIENGVASINSIQQLLDIVAEDDNNGGENGRVAKSISYQWFNDNKILELLESVPISCSCDKKKKDNKNTSDNNSNNDQCNCVNASKSNKRRIIWKIGQIEFKGISLKYFAEEEPVLKDLSFTINGGERIGIVGRTGAGKSSIVSVLFRLYNFDGSILIDGIDTKLLSLNALRTSLGVIPQDPVLFCDSLRKNLDPFNDYNDEQLWHALDVVKLKRHVIENLSTTGLDHHISEGGRNFSVGQRQLVCLARAILKAPKILVMDEATANVDPETDILIQKTIKDYFINSTVITIAHRLNTVLDYDRILVMDAGKVVEFDTVNNLLMKEDGHFKSMLSNSAKRKNK